MHKEGKSWKDKLRAKINEIAYYSKNLEDFFRNCTENGIEYIYKPNNKYKLKFPKLSLLKRKKINGRIFVVCGTLM